MTTRTENRQASLKRRIRRFYNLLNQGDFRRCHQMIDPRVRLKPSSVTLFQYENALRQFLDRFGSVEVLEIHIDLHVNEPSILYEDRDFAVGQTAWEDEVGQRHDFSERWVCEGRTWYTRSTGFVTPATPQVMIPPEWTEESSVSRRRRKQPRKAQPG
jgi:hypothetical protein